MRRMALAGCVLLLAVSGCSCRALRSRGLRFRGRIPLRILRRCTARTARDAMETRVRRARLWICRIPVYQGWVDEATLRKIIANGEAGPQMPAFGQAAGGFLTGRAIGFAGAWDAVGVAEGGGFERADSAIVCGDTRLATQPMASRFIRLHVRGAIRSFHGALPTRRIFRW